MKISATIGHGTICECNAKGLLRRASIVANEIVPVGKETDRHWQQGEDLSMVDFKVQEYRDNGNMVAACLDLIEEIKNRGLRELMRTTGLSQHTIEAVTDGKRFAEERCKGYRSHWESAIGTGPSMKQMRSAT